eukprot:2229194-Amphidinium_carterae.1
MDLLQHLLEERHVMGELTADTKALANQKLKGQAHLNVGWVSIFSIMSCAKEGVHDFPEARIAAALHGLRPGDLMQIALMAGLRSGSQLE